MKVKPKWKITVEGMEERDKVEGKEKKSEGNDKGRS
jgi:hypothetical protein